MAFHDDQGYLASKSNGGKMPEKSEAAQRQGLD